MSPSRRPGRMSYFRFYVDDFHGGIDRLTNAEVGQYMRLLVAQWHSKQEKAVPAEPEELAFICRGEPPSEKVLAKFDRLGPCLRNARLGKEWDISVAEYEGKSRGGKRAESGTETGAVTAPDTGPQPRTKNQEPRAGARAKRKRTSGAKAPVPTWTSEACDDWNARFGDGTAPGGRIGKGLKLVVDRYGWEQIRPVWQRYLRDKDAEFASPQDFAAKLGMWLQKKVPQSKGEQFIQQTKEVLRRFLEEEGPDAP